VPNEFIPSLLLIYQFSADTQKFVFLTCIMFMSDYVTHLGLSILPCEFCWTVRWIVGFANFPQTLC